MYSRPLVVGTDISLGLAEGYALERLREFSGYNTGNILFSEALFRSIRNAKRTYIFTPEPDLIADSDIVVISAANWLGTHHEMTWLAEWMGSTQLPVTIVGLGAQAENGSSPIDVANSLPAGTKRALAMLSERSRSLSVRGEFSQDVLQAAGIKNTIATGCPSLLLKTESIRPAPHDMGWSDVALHGTRYGWGRAAPFHEWFYKKSLQSDADIIYQSEMPELAILDKSVDQSEREKAIKILSEIYDAPPEETCSHIEAHGHIFWTFEDWTTFLSTKPFCLGTRIHGAIAALCAGTPATLVTHDRRTEEMAKALHIPFVPEEIFKRDHDLPPLAFYDESKMAHFQTAMSGYRSRFSKFFADNLIPVTFDNQSGETNVSQRTRSIHASN